MAARESYISDIYWDARILAQIDRRANSQQSVDMLDSSLNICSISTSQ